MPLVAELRNTEAHGQRWPSQVITSLCVPQGRNGRSSRVRINRSKGKQGRTTQDPCNLVAFNTGHALTRRIVPRVSSVSALFRQPDEIYRRITSRHVNINIYVHLCFIIFERKLICRDIIYVEELKLKLYDYVISLINERRYELSYFLLCC